MSLLKLFQPIIIVYLILMSIIYLTKTLNKSSSRQDVNITKQLQEINKRLTKIENKL